MDAEQLQQSHFSDSSDDEQGDVVPLSPGSRFPRDNLYCALTAIDKGYQTPSSAVRILNGEIVPWARNGRISLDLARRSWNRPWRVDSGVRMFRSSPLNPTWADIDEEEEREFEASIAATAFTDKAGDNNVTAKLERIHARRSTDILNSEMEASSAPEQSAATIVGIRQHAEVGAKQDDDSANLVEREQDWTDMNTKASPESLSEKLESNLGMKQKQRLAAAKEFPNESCSSQALLEKYRILLHLDIEEHHARHNIRGQPHLPVPKTESQQRRNERYRALLREYIINYKGSEARCEQLRRHMETASKQVDELQTLLQDALEIADIDSNQELKERVERQEEELAQMKQKLADTKQLCKEKLRAEQDRCEKLQEHVSELEEHESSMLVPIDHVGKSCVQVEQQAQAEELKMHLEEIQARYSDLQEEVDRLSTHNQQLEKDLEAGKRERYIAQPATASTEQSIDWPKTRPFSPTKGSRACAASSSAKLGAAPSIASEAENMVTGSLPYQHADSPTAQSTSASTLVKQIKKNRRVSTKAIKESFRSTDDSYNAVPPPLPASTTGIRLGFARQAAWHRDYEPPQSREWQKRVKKWRRSTVWREHHELISRFRQQQDEEQSEYELLKHRAFETRFGYSLNSGVPCSKQDRVRLFHGTLHGPGRHTTLTMQSVAA